MQTEGHDNDPAMDFDIFILQRDRSLTPAAITLDDVMDAEGTFLFDPSRTTGAEFFQAQYVTLQNVTITNPEGWEKYGALTVTDGMREFGVKLGYNEAFDSVTVPGGPVDITGIFDQDSWNTKGGYLMWATRPGAFLPAGSPIPGDANADGQVTDADAAILATHWQASGAGWFDGDFNADGIVNDADAAILATHWQEGVGEAAAVPEPGSAVLLMIAAAAMLLRCVWGLRPGNQ